MKRQILISSIILLFIQTLASAVNRYVPSRDYPTIQRAITVAANGDVVIVAPGVYTGTGNVNLDFGGKAITVRSQINPANPNPAIIAATIIDCGGNVGLPLSDPNQTGFGAANRAFWFHHGEGNNSQVTGFTIRNGYARGPKGADGQFGYDGDPLNLFIPIPTCDDPCNCPPYALNGDDAPGGAGFGGAILCENASSPTIMHCVIKDCTVTGPHGGNGADGLSGTWYHWTRGDEDPCNPGQIDPNAAITENPDGQWGGSGGQGSGNGCGGAIACRGGSNPFISNCTISDNFARGGRGGDGGNGGDAASTGTPPTYSGAESGGGNAGESIGDGIGGAIYCDGSSNPTITNCAFSNNAATTGPRGAGGQRGLGTEADPRTPEGSDGLVYSITGGIAGGAAYYVDNSHVNDTNCTFTGNKAYAAYPFYYSYFGEDIWRYTVGGALYSGTSNIVNLNTCDFVGNLGGAVYCDIGCNLNFDDCLFTNNSEITNGGAVYIDSSCTVDLHGCIFGGNSAYDDGGALKCRSNATLTNCSFGNNKADSDNDGYGYGGAIDAYQSGTTLRIDANACSFVGNQAIYGGGFSSENFHNTKFTNCYFIGNTAHDGGGLDLVNGDFSVTGGIVKGNNATDGDGGGFDCWYTIADINNCTISDNFADGAYPTSGNGGAINFYGEAPTQRVFNCLITGNSAAVDGGAIFCNYASPNIGNCTFSGDSAAGYGGAIFADWGSSPQITDCIFKGCNNHAVHEEVFGGNAIVGYSLFYNNLDRDYYESDTFTSYNFGSVADPNGNFNRDPCFVSGPLGNFYLNQTSSPAINSGSATAAFLGLNTYTTDANNAFDLGQVDRGYHYPISTSVQTFHLTASVVGGHGMVVPTSPEPVDYNSTTDIYTYYAGTIVTLTAMPDGGWRVKAWGGTDDDSSTATTNTVVMNSDKSVTVEFKQGRTLIVAAGGGQQGYYSNIQDAVGDANDGDTIVVYPGIYNGGYESISVYVDKSVTITSVHPDDPCCVAATIIDGYRQSPFNEGYVNAGVEFGPHTNTDTIFDGFTVQNCGGYVGGGLDGDRSRNHPNGYDGGSGYGAALMVSSGGGPVIKNCIIRNNVIIGGNGGNGVSADTTHNAGRGGWGGYAYGGAVYCDVDSSWIFINCQIIDNYVQGGNGGNGGGGVVDGGSANYGGNWSITGTPEFPVRDFDPDSRDITYVTDGGLWERWGYIGDYRWYSAYGGGVFCNTGSTVTFIHCTISGNRTVGGVSGQGGPQPPSNRPFEPLIPYEIPTFGGGVYCAAESTVTFTDCTVTNNLASEPNQSNNHLDPYLGHGGGVCAEDTAKLTFTNCTFSENTANVGGGTHFANANPTISDCNFISNSAFQGGGLFGEHGPVSIIGCNIISNEAASNDSNIVILGNGGGLHLWATETNIIDCNISGNQAEDSGGGVFFGGENASSLTNCLLTKNTAKRDGGAISTGIFAQLAISNCTIVGNTGISYGGGLNCSYGSYANIINSIIWSNVGIHGSQIAVGTGFEYDERPSTVDISYSDVGVPPYEYSAPIDPNRLPVIRAGFDDSNLPANDDESTGLVDIGFTLNLFGIETSGLYVNNNGNVTFDANMMTYTPFGLTGNIGRAIIAPFFADVDTRATDSNLVTYGTGTVNGRPAFGINWLNVGYFNTHADKLNSFQLILIDRSDRAPGDFDIEFNYETLNWETGDASGGVNGFGGQSAHAGFSSGTGEPGTFYEFEGSGVSRAFLDSSTTGLIYGSRKSSVNGRYIFAVQGGLPELLTSRPFYVDTNCVLSGFDPNNDTNSWDPNSNLRNISKDPNFISGYLLSQIAAGQEVNSPCVDAGSDLASAFGLDTYTTRTDSISDDANVDMGYHYNLFTPTQYELTVRAFDINGVENSNLVDPNGGLYYAHTTVRLTVTSAQNPGFYDFNDIVWSGTNNDDSNEPNNTVTMDGNKTVTVRLVKSVHDLTVNAGSGGTVAPPWSPGIYTVKHRTVVALEAVPDEGYRVKSWSENNDVMSTDPCYTVTVDSDKIVTVEFEQPRTITVPGDYIDIQSAIGAARLGDIVKVASGVHNGSHIVVDKEITVTSTNPDDPRVVAATIIDSSGYADNAVVFYTGATQNTVFDGFTIKGGTYNPIDAQDTNAAGQNGFDGYSIGGGAVYVYSGASPTIKNCVITDTNITGGNASDGGNADATVPAGRGGWAGGSYGGGIYIDSDANPTLINCTITNCVVRGGNAGNGGNSSGTYPSPDYRDANHGGSWSNDETFPWQSLVGSNGQPYLGDYWYYSGLGGGVFCAPNSSATFIACNITNNTAFGGMSGIGGTRPWVIPDPVIAYRIPSFGGGVFCADDTNVSFIDCNITGNTAPRPDSTYHIDPYLGHGGGIAFSQTAYIEFTNCNIADNNAAVGGGMYWTGGDPQLFDCNIAGNVAYVGGGIYGTESTSLLKGCTFSGNFAGVSPNDVDTNAIGQGGGIYGASMESQIIDCTIIDNEAAASGGGIFFSGIEASTPMVKNCLVVDNQAGRDGGGLSVNWYAAPLITNCTIVGNGATGNFGEPGKTGLGGGIYSGYHSHSVILNSILWNNYALRGEELAVGTGFEYDPRPSTVDINNSDIKGAQTNAFVDTGCTLNWGTRNIYADPCFVTGPFGGYYLSQTDTNDPNQTVDSPCVDKGSGLASSVGLHLYTTRTDEVFDTNIVDMGYHYPLTHPIELCSLCDLSHDGEVNLVDFAIFSLYWLNEGCSADNNWCGGADLTFDTYVNSDDLTSFYECWLAEDTNAPVPNPSKWEIVPYSTTLTPPYTVSMTAEAAFDAWGGVVEYYFECVTGNDSNSGWDPNRTHISTSLVHGTVYGYRVKARDERGNETLWSVAGYVIAGEGASPMQDHNAPTPNPMTWATTPHAISPTKIAMVATTATDDTASVQYYFEDVNVPDVNSGWQINPSWTDTTCEPNTTYTYRVKARDTSFWQNETGWSDPCSATTPAEGNEPPPDTTKPLPNPSRWAAGGAPSYYQAYYAGCGCIAFWHTMTAEPTSDATTGGHDPVEYYFEETTGYPGDNSSGWQLSNTYNYPVSINPVQHGMYTVKTRDTVHNETTPSDPCGF